MFTAIEKNINYIITMDQTFSKEFDSNYDR